MTTHGFNILIQSHAVLSRGDSALHPWSAVAVLVVLMIVLGGTAISSLFVPKHRDGQAPLFTTVICTRVGYNFFLSLAMRPGRFTIFQDCIVISGVRIPLEKIKNAKKFQRFFYTGIAFRVADTFPYAAILGSAYVDTQKILAILKSLPALAGKIE